MLTDEEEDVVVELDAVKLHAVHVVELDLHVVRLPRVADARRDVPRPPLGAG